MPTHSDCSKEGPRIFPLRIPSINRQWERVLHLGTKRVYSANEPVLCEKAICNDLLYLASGRVRCEHPGIKGNLKICFYAESGSIFAEAVTVCRGPVVANFVATKRSIIYAFSRETLRDRIVVQHPDLAFNLMEAMAYKIRMYSMHLCSITLSDIGGQVCRILYHILLENRETRECVPRISQQEIGDMLGVHRNTVVRAVRRSC